MTAWLSPLVPALGAGLLVEAIYFLARRHFPHMIERLRYQTWALAIVALVYLTRGASELLPPLVLSWTEFFAIVVSCDLGYRLLDRYWLSRQRDGKGRLAIPKLVRDLLGWIVVATAALVAAAELDLFSLGQWAIPSAVVSAVLGFALQDVLKNLFAGLALQTEAPFETGDWLVFGEEPRQVLEMTWRSTRFRNSLGVDFVEPNANLAAAQLTNLGSGAVPMGFEIRVLLGFDAPPGEVRASLERAARSCPSVVDNPPPVALVHSFADHGVYYRLRFWSTQVGGVMRLLGEVQARVWYQLRRDGWTIPWPLRSIEIDRASARTSESRKVATASALALFARVDVLAALPDGVRARLAESARHQHFDAGEKLVVEGATGDSLMVIARGSVLVSKSGTAIGATSIKLATLSEGDYFGEMSLLTGAPRSATVTAHADVEVFVLDRAALAPLLQQDPKLAETLSQVLAQRIAATVATLEDRREALRRGQVVEPHTLLHKIRDFFRIA